MLAKRFRVEACAGEDRAVMPLPTILLRDRSFQDSLINLAFPLLYTGAEDISVTFNRKGGGG
ncbi:hypothetical protein PMI07_005348 [Rhizobium sp. CF080]|nr:hypothetical protein PMI07_005348 [Rhizobium sp. CF080]